jgi:hypothetical protein
VHQTFFPQKTRIYAVAPRTTLAANAIAHSAGMRVFCLLSQGRTEVEPRERDAVHPTERDFGIAEKCVCIVRHQVTPIESVNCRVSIVSTRAYLAATRAFLAL